LATLAALLATLPAVLTAVLAGGLAVALAAGLTAALAAGLAGCYFIFSSSLFSYRLKGTVVATSLVRIFRSTSGVGACCRSTVSRASFFDLRGGDTNVRFEMLYHRSIFKVV
jgi:hypothetical protein